MLNFSSASSRIRVKGSEKKYSAIFKFSVTRTGITMGKVRPAAEGCLPVLRPTAQYPEIPHEDAPYHRFFFTPLGSCSGVGSSLVFGSQSISSGLPVCIDCQTLSACQPYTTPYFTAPKFNFPELLF